MDEWNIDPKAVLDHSDFTPPRDPELIRYMQQALRGEIPVYYAAIPLKLIKPFSGSYDPRRSPIGRRAIQQVQEEWKNQKFKCMLVYPQQNVFVMSDDYITYFASLEGQPDYVPCWVLGACTSPEACDVQGPIRKEDVRKILFGAAEE
jgi:hypothetical protein